MMWIARRGSIHSHHCTVWAATVEAQEKYPQFSPFPLMDPTAETSVLGSTDPGLAVYSVETTCRADVKYDGERAEHGPPS